MTPVYSQTCFTKKLNFSSSFPSTNYSSKSIQLLSSFQDVSFLHSVSNFDPHEANNTNLKCNRGSKFPSFVIRAIKKAPRPPPMPRKNPTKVKVRRTNLYKRSVRNASSLSPDELRERLLTSPQLSPELAQFPLLSALMSPLPLTNRDENWMEEYMDEIHEGLGFPMQGKEITEEITPLSKIDDLLYLSFIHRDYPLKPRHLKVANSRLAFLGGFVLQLAFAELLLQRYPLETPAALRERVFALTSKRKLPHILMEASLDRMIFPNQNLYRVDKPIRVSASKSVFLALLSTAYLSQGMKEVYRVLFEVFGLDMDAEDAQPYPGRSLDQDHLHPLLQGETLTWKDIANYVPPADAMFPNPRLFHACVPPGMQRFRGSDWMYDSLGPILKALAYPRPSPNEDVKVKQARNEELALTLQLAFMHPSLYKRDHPRFSFERLEYLGQTIQDLVLAERLLMSFIDAPGIWLQDKHNKILKNRLCGRYLREKKLDEHIQISDQFRTMFEINRRVRVPVHGSVQQAVHGAGYLVYGRPEVRRLMFNVWKLAENDMVV